MKPISIKSLLVIFLSATTILGVIQAVSILYQVPISRFTRDPSAIAGMHPISGVLSNLGILLWCVAGSICAFAAMILRSTKSKEKYLYLISSSLLTAYLMLDDLFLIHDDLVYKIGLNENIIFLLLGIAVLTYIVYFRKMLLKTNVVIFLIALTFLTISLVIDVIVVEWLKIQLGSFEFFLEDGAKWIGIVFWCSYYVDTSFHFIERNSDVSRNTTLIDSPLLPS